MKPEDYSWLACAIDGEGSINVRINHKPPMVSLAIYNTSFEFVKHASELMGSPIYVNRKKPNGKSVYETVLYKREMVGKILELIIPYLIIKKEKAVESLKWIQENPAMAPSESGKLAHRKGNPRWRKEGLKESK